MYDPSSHLDKKQIIELRDRFNGKHKRTLKICFYTIGLSSVLFHSWLLLGITLFFLFDLIVLIPHQIEVLNTAIEKLEGEQ